MQSQCQFAKDESQAQPFDARSFRFCSEAISVSFQQQEMDRIYLQESRPLLAFLSRRTDNLQDAEDLLQDVYLRYRRMLDNSDKEISNGRAYLYRIAHNLSYDYRHKRKKLNCLSGMTDGSASEIVSTLEANLSKAPVHNSPQDYVDAEQLLLTLINTLNSMRPNCKKIFILGKIGGMRYAQIAATLGLTPKAVEHQMSCGMKILRKAGIAF